MFRHYEVWLFGELVGTFPTISAATLFVEALFVDSKNPDRIKQVVVKAVMEGEENDKTA